jgi:hypothetical protein
MNFTLFTSSVSAFLLAVLAIFPMAATAQKNTAEGIAEYRAMLADGNPADLYEARGEGLWKQARGPKNVSLEKCDLGKGAGVVKGAFVELPRFFTDTQRVQDLESRLLNPPRSRWTRPRNKSSKALSGNKAMPSWSA